MNYNVSWYRYDKKFKCVVGYLNYDEIWSFEYDKEGLEVACNLGFVGFPEFPDINETYYSPVLFKTFDNRIRRDKSKISESAKIELLNKTKGVLATDNIVITKPMVYNESKHYAKI